MSRSFQLKEIQTDVMDHAVEISNGRFREELLEDLVDAFFESMPVDITHQNISVLRYAWGPVNPNAISPSGLGVFLDSSDPLIQTLMVEEDLYDEAHDIIMEAFVEVIMESDLRDRFFTMMLNDLLIEEDPFYKAETK